MNYQTVKKLQKQHGFANMQRLIDSGDVWKMEGSMGREASLMLEMGACFLPKTPKRDYYGNRIPSRDEVKAGTKGSWGNTVNYFLNL